MDGAAAQEMFVLPSPCLPPTLAPLVVKATPLPWCSTKGNYFFFFFFLNFFVMYSNCLVLLFLCLVDFSTY
jgi:hypothetical protein